jgi:DnaJ-class molecular chaperone
MKKWVVCYYCQGNGWFRDEKTGALITCPECHGAGAWVEEVEEEEEEKNEKKEEKD